MNSYMMVQVFSVVTQIETNAAAYEVACPHLYHGAAIESTAGPRKLNRTVPGPTNGLMRKKAVENKASVHTSKIRACEAVPVRSKAPARYKWPERAATRSVGMRQTARYSSFYRTTAMLARSFPNPVKHR